MHGASLLTLHSGGISVGTNDPALVRKIERVPKPAIKSLRLRQIVVTKTQIQQ